MDKETFCRLVKYAMPLWIGSGAKINAKEHGKELAFRYE
jgi:hypothetical protein